MHKGTKLEYLFFQSSRLFQACEIQLLKNQCEQERTQILTILILSLENLRLAGFMLTRNGSMFQKNWWQLSLALPLPTSSFTTSYDEPVIRPGPDFLRRPFPIRWLITRQTHPVANLKNCTDCIKNLFQFDMDPEDSWYTLTLGIVHQDSSGVFAAKDVSPVAVHFFLDLKMLECTLEANSVFFGTVSWSVLPPKTLWKSFRKNSLSFETTTKTRTVFPILLLEQISW